MKNKNISIITLGCSKNTVESEAIAAEFIDNNYNITNNVYDTDMILIHTCSFIEDAQLESKYQIENACKLKQQNKNLKVFVSGCLPQLLKDDFFKQFPSVDGYVGTGDYKNIVKLIQANKFFAKTKNLGGITCFKKRIITSGLPSTYIKISEGCDHRCSYCVIPNIRGSYQSRTIKSIVDEAKSLADFGIKELNVIAQDTTSYGVDIYGQPSLDKLLKQLSKISSLKWIRLLYAYPSTITKNLLETIASCDNICKYIDIPIQHISKNILSKMYRPLNTRTIIEKIKSKYPQISLRTSLIVGFPSETKKDFNELKQFVKQNYFEHVGIFGYSDQSISKSFLLKNKIAQNVIDERKQILATLQYENVIKNNSSKIGKEYEVFVENIDKNNSISRAYFQAPEIDNNIIVKNLNLKIGSFNKVKITKTKGYDLIAKI